MLMPRTYTAGAVGLLCPLIGQDSLPCGGAFVPTTIWTDPGKSFASLTSSFAAKSKVPDIAHASAVGRHS